MTNHLSVTLHRSISLDAPCTTEGKPSKYLDVSLQYCPKMDSTGNFISSEEIYDRSWFKELIDFNPSIDNLSEVVNASAKKMIEQVKPAKVYLSVRLSNDVDLNGFCTKEVNFNWSEEEA